MKSLSKNTFIYLCTREEGLPGALFSVADYYPLVSLQLSLAFRLPLSSSFSQEAFVLNFQHPSNIFDVCPKSFESLKKADGKQLFPGKDTLSVRQRNSRVRCMLCDTRDIGVKCINDWHMKFSCLAVQPVQ